MKYISPYQREPFDNKIEDLTIETAGELQYCIARLIKQFEKSGLGSYDDMNEVMGVLNLANLEYYQRIRERGDC